MRDEIYDRMWVENHEAFSASIDRGLARLMAAFKTLARINYSAPWDLPPNKRKFG